MPSFSTTLFPINTLPPLSPAVTPPPPNWSNLHCVYIGDQSMLRHAEDSPVLVTPSPDLLTYCISAPFLLKHSISFQRKARAMGDDGCSDQVSSSAEVSVPIICMHSQHQCHKAPLNILAPQCRHNHSDWYSKHYAYIVCLQNRLSILIYA